MQSNGDALQAAIVEARGVEKYYVKGDRRIQVISPTDISIHEQEIIALLGPSGCGKSTFLRLLLGLSPSSAGEILWHGKALDGKTPNASIVFQSFALFPWLTVFQNVEAPLLARGMEKNERRERALKILDTVGLDGFESAYPKELSGGMKQRVGVARALVVEPEVLFMDEPFSALDVLTAENLRRELLELWLNKKMPTKAIFIVTHNIEEAVLLATRIIVLGSNPAHIRSHFNVALPRPRDHHSKNFSALVDFIYTVLTRPEIEAVSPLKRIAEPAVEKYPMLPHARPGGVTGLLEMLKEHSGREDLYRLADELSMEVDDILPILDACALLRFARVEEGDVEITPEGLAFAEAGILHRKTLFHDAALQHVTLLRQIERGLRFQPGGSLPEEFFLDVLEEHFSPDEAKRQLETAIGWGRYAEIFDYNADEERFFLPEPPAAEAAPEKQ